MYYLKTNNLTEMHNYKYTCRVIIIKYEQIKVQKETGINRHCTSVTIKPALCVMQGRIIS